MSTRELTGQHEQAARDGKAEATRRFWVVPHTHWDREWYLPFEQLRVRLGRVLDEIIDLLERESELAFTLDGQSVLLEDYLEVRPDQEPRLRALLTSGRLAAGPSYVLPDEFLSGQETLVRNLLMGRQVCGRFGAAPMQVAYAPDTFGHAAQLPQLLRGFGIDSFVFWRGLGDDSERLGAVFTWEGHDSSQVTAIRLLGGYAALKNLGRWTRAEGPIDDTSSWARTAPIQVREYLERFGAQFERSRLADFLVCSGDDHEPMQADLLEMVRACEAGLPGSSFQVATLADYIDALRWQHRDEERHRGEMVGGYEACVVRGVNSTRMYLKQANEEAERALLSAEVLASLSYLRTGATFPRLEMQLAWRELLKNQPHDSLPGCSVDEVHRDMEQRFRSARQIAEEVSREALRQMAGAPRPARPWMEDFSRRSVVNTLPWRRTRVVEIGLPEGLNRPISLAAECSGGLLPVQVSGKRGERRALVAVDLQGFASRSVNIVSGKVEEPRTGAKSTSGDSIENEYFRVEAAVDGTLAVTNLRSGQRWEGFHWFQDEADRGDEYSFCPVEGDVPWDSRTELSRTRVLSAGPVVAEMEISVDARLPKRLRPRRRARSRSLVACPIRTTIRLCAGIDRIEFRTVVDNRAEEHRLRVVFPAPGSGKTVRAESAFAMIERPARPVWNGRWREPPTDTHHMAGVVTAGKLALMSKGLPEYEAIPSGEGVDLALTLLRCVGFLSWGDLETRVGAQEPHIPTPDAQCPGKHAFEYAISLRGDEGDAGLIRASQDYRTDFALGPLGQDFEGPVQLGGAGYAFAALKGAEDGDGLVLRIYSPGEEASARVSGEGLLFRRCQLDETGPKVENVGEVQMRGGEIVTMRVWPNLAEG